MPSAYVKIDLTDVEDSFKFYYCDNGNCLRKKESLYQDIKEYVDNMYKTLYLTIDNSRDIKTMEQIMNDLQNILGEYE